MSKKIGVKSLDFGALFAFLRSVRRYCELGVRHDQGSFLIIILAFLAIGAVLAGRSLFVTTQKQKTSVDYASCQRALNAADAGADRVISELINTPDTNNDGIYNDAPPATLDTYDIVKIFDLDGNNINDFDQLFARNKNVPDVTGVAEANAIRLFYPSDHIAYVWAEANKPLTGQATIYSYAKHGRCKKKVMVIIDASLGGYVPGAGRGMGAPVMVAQPN